MLFCEIEIGVDHHYYYYYDDDNDLLWNWNFLQSKPKSDSTS